MSHPNRPPGPPNLFGIRSFRRMQKERLDFMLDCASYGPIAYVPMLWEEYYMVNEPDLVQEALVKAHTKMRKDRFTAALSRAMGQGLVSSEGELWRRQRKLVSQAFTPKRITGYAGAMVDATHRTLAGWNDGDEIDVHAAMTELTLDVVGRTLFDADVRGNAIEVGEALHVISKFYVDVIEKPFTPPEWWPSRKNRKFVNAVRNVDRIILQIIDERRKSGEDRGDLLSALLQAQDDDGGGMDDQQLRDECVTLFLAGHETTSIALSNTLYLLSQHPDVAEKLYAEVIEVLGDRRAAADDVKRLELTERVVKESMRLYPPVYTVGRELLEDYELGGYRLPKGATLLFTPWVTQRDPRSFPKPERFDPDRWLPERAKDMHKFAYFPFGGGPRICVGNHFAMMEAILLLATITREYTLELVPGETLDFLASVTLRPAHGLRMRLVARSPGSARAA